VGQGAGRAEQAARRRRHYNFYGAVGQGAGRAEQAARRRRRYDVYGTAGQGAGRVGQAAGRDAARGHDRAWQGWVGLTARPGAAPSHGDDVAEGLESVPTAPIGHFHNHNVSKQLIRVVDE
jgi:hypothetical protein